MMYNGYVEYRCIIHVPIIRWHPTVRALEVIFFFYNELLQFFQLITLKSYNNQTDKTDLFAADKSN